MTSRKYSVRACILAILLAIVASVSTMKRIRITHHKMKLYEIDHWNDNVGATVDSNQPIDNLTYECRYYLMRVDILIDSINNIVNFRLPYKTKPIEPAGGDCRTSDLSENSQKYREMQKIREHFRKYELLKTLENEDISIDQRAELAKQEMYHCEDSSPMVPDLSRGGLYRDWNSLIE